MFCSQPKHGSNPDSVIKKIKSHLVCLLFRGLPKDDPNVNREDLLAQGFAHTLFDVAKIQSTLGTCTCAGRQAAATAARMMHMSVRDQQLAAVDRVRRG